MDQVEPNAASDHYRVVLVSIPVCLVLFSFFFFFFMLMCAQIDDGAQHGRHKPCLLRMPLWSRSQKIN